MNKKRQRQEIGGENGFEHWGGYMAAKKAKLQGQFFQQASKEGCEGNQDGIFKGVSIFVNGYTVPSADELKRIMMMHGGVYHHYHSTEHTTHIIATNLPDVKVKQLKSLHVRVVKPEWIVACLEAKRQVDYRPYLLYSHQSTTQPSLFFSEGSKKGFSSSTITSNNESSEGALRGQTENALGNNVASTTDVDSEHLLSATEHQNSLPHENEAGSKRAPPSSSSPNNKEKSSKINVNSSRCATEPNFLSEFYSNSRLHHISTMGAMFKQYVCELRAKCNGNFPGLERLREWKKQHTNTSLHEIRAQHDSDLLFAMDAPHTDVTKHASTPNKIVMHIDMDCFFVSVGLRDHPELRGKPVAVTHSKGGSAQPNPREGADRKYELNYYKERLKSRLKNKAGAADEETLAAKTLDSKVAWIDTIDETNSMAEIASCSYEARKAGVTNGMFMGTALKLCPNLKTIPYNFEGYKEVAYTLYNTVASYTLDIEAVSCDEMFVDCTSLLRETNTTPLEFAACIRQEIKEKTLCPASTGFGINKLLARLATRKAKPDGQFYLEPSAVADFMKTIKVEDLPGVGRSMAYRLQAMGVSSCEDLQNIPLTKLHEFGSKTGETLYNHCRGHDDRPLNFGHQRKSVSAEVNYGIRFKNHIESEQFLRQLAKEVETRLCEVNMRGRCITLKLMVRADNAPSEAAKFMGHGVCDYINKSSTLPSAIADADSIFREVLLIMKKLTINPSELRGIGIQISRLESMSGSTTGALDKFLVKNDSVPSCSKAEDREHEICEATTSVINNEPEAVLPSHEKAAIPTSTNSAQSLNGKKKTFKSPLKRSAVLPKGLRGIDQFMVSRKKTTRKDNPAKLPSPAELDLDVLDTLPEDIRNEILEEYSSRAEPKASTSKIDSPLSTLTDCPAKNMHKFEKKSVEETCTRLDVSLSQVDPSFLDALPSHLRREVENDLLNRKMMRNQNLHDDYQRSETSKDIADDILGLRLGCVRKQSILSSLVKPEEVRMMIRSWVAEQNEPLPLDVHILKHYLHDLVTERHIDELHLIVKCFHRCVNQRASTIWAEKYHDIVSTMQTAMQHVYQARLHVEEYVSLPS